MIHHSRPPRPTGWPPRSITDAQDAVRADRAAGLAPTFPDHWRAYKDQFEPAQFGKCGFCESKVTVVSVGAVEHHAPKSEVQALDARGEEHADSSNVKGRKTPVLHAHGYWWRAYDWDNWLYACDRCNSAWKRCLYPVAEDPHPAPDEATAVTALLLHPYDDEPLDHLDFDEQGFILAWQHSPRGNATIATCGLDRESLRKERAAVAGRADRHARRVAKAIAEGTDRVLEDNVVDLLDLGAPASAWAGVVRATVRRVLALDWVDLPTLLPAI